MIFQLVDLRTKVIKAKDLERTIVDTTVQEKDITYQKDAKLYHIARILLVTLARDHGLKFKTKLHLLRGTSILKSSNYARARHMKRAKKEAKKLKIYLGRIYKEVERDLEKRKECVPHFRELLDRIKRLLS